MSRFRAVLVAVALLASGRAQAQDAVQAVRAATERLDYAEAERLAREALSDYDALAPDQLAELHTALGVLLAARADDIEARVQFEAALSLDPARTLDPVLVPPRTVALFESVRASLDPAAPAPPGAVRYVVLPDRRAGGALRSAVLPGWGQAYKGDRRRAVVSAIAVGTLAAATVASHVAYGRARDRYAVATADVEAAYDEANRLYRLRSGLGIATALVWAAQVTEALVTGRPRASVARVGASAGGAGLSLNVRF